MALGAPARPRLGASHSLLAGADLVERLQSVARLVTLVIALELIYIALASPRLAIREVELRGDQQVTGQLSAALDLPASTNFFRAPTGELARQLRAVPAIRDARVDRDFPNRLVVTIEKREAVAVIRASEQATLVDAQGVVYWIRDEWGWGLPELFAPHLQPGKLGEAGAKRELPKLLAVMRALGPDPRLRVARLELGSEDAITAVLESGARVRLGSPEQLEAKVELLGAALERLGAGRIGTLDVSDPAAPYWVPRGASAPVPVPGRPSRPSGEWRTAPRR